MGSEDIEFGYKKCTRAKKKIHQVIMNHSMRFAMFREFVNLASLMDLTQSAAFCHYMSRLLGNWHNPYPSHLLGIGVSLTHLFDVDIIRQC